MKTASKRLTLTNLSVMRLFHTKSSLTALRFQVIAGAALCLLPFAGHAQTTEQPAEASAKQNDPVITPDWAKLHVSQQALGELAPGPALVSALRRTAAFGSVQPTQQRITLTYCSLQASIANAQQPTAVANQNQSQVLERTQTQTQMLMRVLPSKGTAQAMFRIDAGNLLLSLKSVKTGGHALIAVNTLNTDLYFQRDIAAGADLWSAVQAGLPPLALPTLAWALQGEAEFVTWQQQLAAPQLAATGGHITTNMPLVGKTTWHGVTPDGSLIVGDNCVMRVDRATGQPLALQLDLSQSPVIGTGPTENTSINDPASLGPWLLVQIEFLAPPRVDADSLLQWEPAIETRTRVPNLTDLVAKPAEIGVGTPVPVLALLDGDLVGWPGLDAMLEAARVEAGSGKAERQRSCILVLFQPSDEAASARAREAALAAEAVQRTFNLRVLSGRPLAPNVMVASAAVMELEEMKAARAKQIVQHWQQSGEARKGLPPVTASPIVFSSGGKQLIGRFAARSKAVVAVIAGDGTLVRAIPLDERAVEREALTRELMGIIRDDGETPSR